MVWRRDPAGAFPDGGLMAHSTENATGLCAAANVGGGGRILEYPQAEGRCGERPEALLAPYIECGLMKLASH